MQTKQLMKCWILILALLCTPAWAAPNLTGQWTLNGQPYLILNKNGTGSMEGEPLNWSVKGNTLILSAGGQTDTLPFQLQGEALTLQAGYIPLTLQRTAGASKDAPRAKSGNAHNGDTSSDQLSQLLLSSAWCTFKYNQYTGSSSSTRYQFFSNGSYSDSGRAESYSSGRYGAVAGQHDSGGAGQWAVRNGQLFLSRPPEQPNLSPVSLSVTRNSSGYAILHANGVEYSMCQ